MSNYNFDLLISRDDTYSAKWQASAQNIIPLSVADMDIPAPMELIAQLTRFNQKGIYGYTDLSPDWAQQVCQWFATQYHWTVPPQHVVFCPRVIQAVSLYIQNFTQPHDAIVALSPGYHPISNAVALNQRRLLESELIYDNGDYHIDFIDLEDKFTQACCFILLSPHNPTGRVWRRDELLKIAKLAEKHQVFIISDEVHADFVFNQAQHQVIATVSDYVQQHSFICTSPAKTFNLAGLEVANIIIANPTTREKFQHCLAAAGIHNPGYFSVPALLCAYQHGEAWLGELKAYLLDNRTLVTHILEQHFPQWVLTKSDGTYLLWVNYQASGITEEQLKHWFVDLAGVEVSWGSDFGAAGQGFFRINIATPRALLSQAMENIISSYPY